MNKLFWAIVLLLLSTYNFAGYCIIDNEGMPQNTEFVSMITTTSNPEKYSGKPIDITGILDVDSDDRLYLYNRQAAIDYVMLSESVYLMLSEDQRLQYLPQIKKLLGKYVSVTGYFNTGIRKGKSSGYLEKILYVCSPLTRSDMHLILQDKKNKSTR